MIDLKDSYTDEYWRQFVHSGKKIPTLVYTMSKVGTTSVALSLVEQGVHPVFHMHYLRPENIIPRFIARIAGPHSQYTAPLAYRIYKEFILGQRKINVITAVREPLSRNISSFFQMGYRFFKSEQEFLNASFEELRELYFDVFPANEGESWFDFELSPALGVDVYSEPFDHKKGYALFENKNIRLLVLKIETDDLLKEIVVKRFLNLERFKLNRKNDSSEKAYKNKYSFFKRNIVFSESYLDEVYGSRYVRHFYSPREIEAFRKRWRSVRSMQYFPNSYSCYYETMFAHV